MQIFQVIRVHLAALGIETKPSTGQSSFSGKLSMSFILLVLSIISSVLFVICEADTVIEFMQCFSVISAIVENSVSFVAIVWQRQRLFNYIEIVESIINKSKSTQSISTGS